MANQLLDIIKTKNVPIVQGCDIICPKQIVWAICTGDQILLDNPEGLELTKAVWDQVNCTKGIKAQTTPSSGLSEVTTESQTRHQPVLTRYKPEITRHLDVDESLDSQEGSGMNNDYIYENFNDLYQGRYSQIENRCSKLDPFCVNYPKTQYTYKPRPLKYWVQSFFLPMLKNIGK